MPGVLIKYSFVTEFPNPGAIWVGRDLKARPVSPLPWAGTFSIILGAPNRVQPSLGHFQGWRILLQGIPTLTRQESIPNIFIIYTKTQIIPPSHPPISRALLMVFSIKKENLQRWGKKWKQQRKRNNNSPPDLTHRGQKELLQPLPLLRAPLEFCPGVTLAGLEASGEAQLGSGVTAPRNNQGWKGLKLQSLWNFTTIEYLGVERSG